jgi:hypothetical protein
MTLIRFRQRGMLASEHYEQSCFNQRLNCRRRRSPMYDHFSTEQLRHQMKDEIVYQNSIDFLEPQR